MNFYPFSAPVLMTDEIYLLYGGEVGTSTTEQRQVAYEIAERQLSRYLHTLPEITLVTGSYRFHPNKPIITEYSYVHAIHDVTLISRDEDSDCSVTETSSCTYINDARYGIIDPRKVVNCYGCAQIEFEPWKVRVVYEAGLPTGVAASPMVLQALSIQSKITLKEIVEALGGNESAGDIGVTEFSTQEYSEKRVGLIRTTFGSSPLSNYVARMVENLRYSRVGTL